MPDWLKVYHRLPYPARVMAAGIRGRQLRRWRYGPQTDQMVDEYLERETWKAEQWRAWEDERLAQVLHRAATQVPYYREQWAARRREGDRAPWDVLANWPVLSKEALRQQPRAFLADDCNADDMFYEHTSGTTGKPLHIWLSRETVQAWFALFEARVRYWYGVGRADRWAIMGGQLVAPVDQQDPPFWVWNPALSQLYLSTYHLKPRNVPAYLAALRQYEVVYLLGYPSALHRLAQVTLDLNLEAPRLRVAIANAEPLYDHQRAVVEQAFGCTVRETYGMAEIAAAASECEAGRLHAWPESGLIEILDDDADRPLPANQPGRLVATGLMNADMPLIRYETGDRATRAPHDLACRCGRTLPLITAIEGRVDDVVITSDGRHVGRLDPVFKADLPIREAQIIQEDLDAIRVLYVPTVEYTEADGEALARRIRDRVGDMTIVLQEVDEVPRTDNGKFRAVISRVSNPQGQAAGRAAGEAAVAGER